MKGLLILITVAAIVLAGYRPVAAQGTSSWKAQNPTFPLAGLDSVGCPSAAVCVAGGDDRMFSTQDGGTHWHHTKVDTGSQVGQVVCASAGSCLALDGGPDLEAHRQERSRSVTGEPVAERGGAGLCHGHGVLGVIRGSRVLSYRGCGQ